MAEVRVWNRSDQVTHGGALLLMGGVSSRALLYVAHVLLARLLEPAQVGLYFLSVTVLQFLSLISLLGIEGAILRFAPQLESEGRRERLDAGLQGVLGWCTLSAIAGSLLLGLEAPRVAGWLNQPAMAGPLRVVALVAPAMVFHRLVTTVFQATLRVPSTLFLRNLLYPLLFLAALPLALAFWPTAGGALLSQWVGLVIPFVLGLRWLRTRLELLRPVQEPRAEASLELLRFGFPLLIAGMVGFAALWSDTLLAGYFLPAAEVARYGVAIRISMLASLLLEAFNGALGPAASRLMARRDGSIEALYRDVTRLSLLLFLPLFGVMLIFPEALLGLFGAAYVTPSTVAALRVLALGQLVNVATGGAGMLLIIAGRPWLNLVNSLVVVALNVVLCAVLIPRLGLKGAAIAAAAGITAVNLARVVEVRWLLGISPMDRRWRAPLVSVCGAMVVAGAARLGLLLSGRGLSNTAGIARESGPADLDALLSVAWAGLGALVLSAVYAVILWRLGVEPEERALLRRLTGRSHPRAEKPVGES